jgi:hypothetical protein
MRANSKTSWIHTLWAWIASNFKWENSSLFWNGKKDGHDFVEPAEEAILDEIAEEAVEEVE